MWGEKNKVKFINLLTNNIMISISELQDRRDELIEELRDAYTEYLENMDEDERIDMDDQDDIDEDDLVSWAGRHAGFYDEEVEEIEEIDGMGYYLRGADVLYTEEEMVAFIIDTLDIEERFLPYFDERRWAEDQLSDCSTVEYQGETYYFL